MKGRAAIRHYANLLEPSDSLRFKLYAEVRFRGHQPQRGDTPAAAAAGGVPVPGAEGGERVAEAAGGHPDQAAQGRRGQSESSTGLCNFTKHANNIQID